MRKKNYYSYNIDPLPEFDTSQIYKDAQLWERKRGFVPKEPLVWNGLLAFPLYDVCGEFQQYQIRSNTEHQFDKTRYQLSGAIYEPVHQTDKDVLDSVYVLVEGSADCALLRSYGINAITCCGAEKFKVLRAKDFLNGKTFFYFFDNDKWGDLMNPHMKNSTGVRLLIPSQYKDFNDFLLKNKQGWDDWINTYSGLLI